MSRKTILALRGRGDSGKTTTIRRLHRLLVSDEINAEVRATNFDPDNDLRERNQIDFWTVFKLRGKILCITSWGDRYQKLLPRFQQFTEAHAEIIVCCCRTRDNIKLGTNAAILGMTEYEHEFVDKTVEDGNANRREAVNLQDATRILNRIMDLTL
jgi:hypothetical protein